MNLLNETPFYMHAVTSLPLTTTNFASFIALLYSCHRVAHRFYYRTHTHTHTSAMSNSNSTAERFKWFCISLQKIDRRTYGRTIHRNKLNLKHLPTDQRETKEWNRNILFQLFADILGKNFHLDWYPSIFPKPKRGKECRNDNVFEGQYLAYHGHVHHTFANHSSKCLPDFIPPLHMLPTNNVILSDLFRIEGNQVFNSFCYKEPSSQIDGSNNYESKNANGVFNGFIWYQR